MRLGKQNVAGRVFQMQSQLSRSSAAAVHLLAGRIPFSSSPGFRPRTGARTPQWTAQALVSGELKKQKNGGMLEMDDGGEP
jgi:hypothetical protein